MIAKSGLVRLGATPVHDHRWKSFSLAATLAAVASVAFAAFLALQPGTPRTIGLVDNTGQTAAALIAVVACARAAQVSIGSQRLAWGLIATAGAMFTASEVAYTIHVVALGVTPAPSLWDAGFIASMVFAIAGIAAFSNRSVRDSLRARLVIDGSIMVIALGLTAWALGFNQVLSASGHSWDELVLGGVYPAGGIMLVSTLGLHLRSAAREQQVRAGLLFGGMAAIVISTCVYSFLQETGAYGLRGSVFDAGWVAGYLMVALSAIMPARKPGSVKAAAPIDIWQLMLPWFTILIAAVTIVVMALQGHQLDKFQTVGTGLLAALLMVSQALAHGDARRLLIESRQTEAVLADVIAQAPAGVVRVGPDLCIRDASPRFGELASIGLQKQVGAPITVFFEQEEATRLAESLAPLIGGTQSTAEDDIESKQSDGSSEWLHWSATRVTRPDGTTDYLILMFEDTTARHQAEAAGAANLAILERLNQLKSDFLHNVSHEFKTALTGIQGFSEFMRDADQLNLSDARAFATDIYRDADRLDRMVTEMLDLDRAETSRATLRLENVDMNALIAHEIGQANKGLDGITIAAGLDPDLPSIVGDAEKLSMVIRTLLESAIKYSPDGGRIAVSSHGNQAGVEVGISDQGTGLRSDFDRTFFGKDDLYANSPIRTVVGTGLGLGIVRQVVEMHGGRIWVEQLEGGSEFHIALPTAPPSRRMTAPAPSGGADQPVKVA